MGQGVVYLRARAANDSEQVSQLLMGATVAVLGEDAGFYRVEGPDTYRGWADSRYLCPVSDTERSEVKSVFAEVRELPSGDAPLVVRLPCLAKVERLHEIDGPFERVRLPFGETGWVSSHVFVPRPVLLPEEIGASAVRFAHEFLGTPYLWGGSSSFGLDCSGLVQYCYCLAGVNLRRDADIQRDDARMFHVKQNGVLDYAELLSGDLVFFGRPERITHVGMHLSGNTVYSCGGRTRDNHQRVGRRPLLPRLCGCAAA